MRVGRRAWPPRESRLVTCQVTPGRPADDARAPSGSSLARAVLSCPLDEARGRFAERLRLLRHEARRVFLRKRDEGRRGRPAEGGAVGPLLVMLRARGSPRAPVARIAG